MTARTRADAPRICPGCGATEGRTVGTLSGFTLISCLPCRTLRTDRLPTASDAEDYAEYYDEENLTVPSFVRHRLDELVVSLDGYRRLNRWLDVGCGAGTLVHSAAERGWQITGTEVAPGAADSLRASGFDVRLGEIDELELPESAFDVVSMVEVIEHVPDPAGTLHAATRLLRPGGALYLTTPHARGLSGRLLGTRWSAVAPPEHLQLFSVAGLRAALAGAGLDERRTQTHGVNPYELLAAVRRGNFSAAPVDRVQTSYRLNEALSSSRARSLVKHAANAFLSATRLGDGIKMTAERRLTSPRAPGTPRG